MCTYLHSDIIFIETLNVPEFRNYSIDEDKVTLQWFHRDECYKECNFVYKVKWQDKLFNTTETSYTIEGIASGTSYEIGVSLRAYCNENFNIRSLETRINIIFTGLYLCKIIVFYSFT